jgi:hypothetical protein
MGKRGTNGGFYCLAHRERVSMSWFSPLLGKTAIRLAAYVLPEDLGAALSKQYEKFYSESFRLPRARALCGIRVAQAFRERHKDCEVDAANLGAPGQWSRRAAVAAERAGLAPDNATFWLRSYMASTPGPFSEADAADATRWQEARLATWKAELRARERRLSTERIPIMERGLIENQVRDAKLSVPLLEADLTEPMPPAPAAELEALMKAIVEDPRGPEIDASP